MKGRGPGGVGLGGAELLLKTGRGQDGEGGRGGGWLSLYPPWAPSSRRRVRRGPAAGSPTNPPGVKTWWLSCPRAARTWERRSLRPAGGA